MLSSLLGLEGASWVVRIRVSVSYLNRNFVVVWWDAGVVMCLGQGADLHMAQLMLLPLTISCSSKSRLILPLWCRLTQAVPDKIQEGRKMVVCVFVVVLVNSFFGTIY